MKIDRFENLNIWEEARELYKIIFALTLTDPFDKDYRLKDQIRASSGSIMDNIAEDFERNGNKEFIQFLYIAKGSCAEVRPQVYRAIDSKYISQIQCDELLQKTEQLSRQISGFINYLKQSGLKGVKYQ